MNVCQKSMKLRFESVFRRSAAEVGLFMSENIEDPILDSKNKVFYIVKVFYALQSERIRFKFYSLSSNPKNAEIQPKH